MYINYNISILLPKAQNVPMVPRKCNSVRISHSCFWTLASHFLTRNVDKVHKAITTKFGKMSTEEPAVAIAGIDQLNAEIQELHMQLAAKKRQLRELQQTAQEDPPSTAAGAAAAATPTPRVNELSNDEIERYSRQLILPGFGVAAQLQLKHSAFLIVGMGGLGCPAAQYLLAAGCGRLGLVDYDDVERSNFHRQTLHTESYIGMPKVQSAQLALIRINPNCQIDMHRLVLNSDNAMDIIAQYDVVLDCTDNVATRYLLNDACVMLHKPLVSGSALQLDGQLTVYHYGATGPCYRCLFPVPPPPETVTNCGDGGVLGAVTGTIGALQALEAIKVVTSLGDVLAGHLLIFDGARCTFRKVRLRGRRSDCDVCSEKPMITRLLNYELFCSMHATDSAHPLQLLSEDERISVQQYRELQAQPHLLIDVRQPAEFEICRLPGAVNVPLKCVLDDSYVERYGAQLSCEEFPTVVLCRRGNDSQIAVQHMRNKFPHSSIRDIVGGLHAWHYKVDKEFPIY